jgi:hypothetical protein
MRTRTIVLLFFPILTGCGLALGGAGPLEFGDAAAAAVQDEPPPIVAPDASEAGTPDSSEPDASDASKPDSSKPDTGHAPDSSEPDASEAGTPDACAPTLSANQSICSPAHAYDSTCLGAGCTWWAEGEVECCP